MSLQYFSYYITGQRNVIFLIFCSLTLGRIGNRRLELDQRHSIAQKILKFFSNHRYEGEITLKWLRIVGIPRDAETIDRIITTERMAEHLLIIIDNKSIVKKVLGNWWARRRVRKRWGRKVRRRFRISPLDKHRLSWEARCHAVTHFLIFY